MNAELFEAGKGNSGETDVTEAADRETQTHFTWLSRIYLTVSLRDGVNEMPCMPALFLTADSVRRRMVDIRLTDAPFSASSRRRLKSSRDQPIALPCRLFNDGRNALLDDIVHTVKFTQAEKSRKPLPVIVETTLIEPPSQFARRRGAQRPAEFILSTELGA